MANVYDQSRGKGKFCSPACYHDRQRLVPAGVPFAGSQGYLYVKSGGKDRPQHVLVVEGVLGRSLPAGAHVHHINGDKTDNRPRNLLVCPSASYHNEIHRKMRVRALGGDPWSQRWCGGCKRLVDASLFTLKHATKYRTPCRDCCNRVSRERRERRLGLAS